MDTFSDYYFRLTRLFDSSGFKMHLIRLLDLPTTLFSCGGSDQRSSVMNLILKELRFFSCYKKAVKKVIVSFPFRLDAALGHDRSCM